MSDHLGFRQYIDGFWEWVRLLGQDLLSNFDVEQANLPTQPTNEELADLTDAMIDTGEAGTEFLFSSHHLGETIINFLSPYNLGVILVAIISLIFGILMLHKFAKLSFKHLILFVLVLAVMTVLIMAIGPIDFPDI